jgi:hypothetical protein
MLQAMRASLLASGVRKYELYVWSLNEGRIDVTLSFSDQTFGFPQRGLTVTGLGQSAS